jgi:hypothetical protein
MGNRLVLLLVFFASLATHAFAETRCLDVDGEAAVVNNDLPTARAEAVARAKWAAVEQAVGVEVKAESIVQNAALVDEAISRQINGVVSRYKVLQTNNGSDVVTVKVNVCVEPSRARDAVAGLALNNSIAVFIPARTPHVIRETGETTTTRSGRRERHDVLTADEHEEANVLSETIIGKLTEQGYTVVDVAPTNVVDAAQIEQAMKSGNFMSLRTLMYKFLTNILLIGKTDYAVSTRKGEDIGYGISMPVNNVTVRLTYRLITRDASGKMVILTAGTEQGKGLKGSVEDAAAEGLKDISEKLAPVILDKVARYIKGGARRVEVKVAGVSELSDNFAVKEVLQNIAWVTNVEERGLGEFLVSYTENPIYLANSIGQKGGFRVEKFTPVAISVQYRK